MKSSLSLLGAILLAVGMASAQDSAATPTTTITVGSVACPTGPAADVIVTRSDEPVPSCDAGNESSKPSIVSMSGYGMNLTQPTSMMSGGASGSTTARNPQFTGAAGKTRVAGALVLVGGAMVLMV